MSTTQPARKSNQTANGRLVAHTSSQTLPAPASLASAEQTRLITYSRFRPRQSQKETLQACIHASAMYASCILAFCAHMRSRLHDAKDAPTPFHTLPAINGQQPKDAPTPFHTLPAINGQQSEHEPMHNRTPRLRAPFWSTWQRAEPWSVHPKVTTASLHPTCLHHEEGIGEIVYVSCRETQ